MEKLIKKLSSGLTGNPDVLIQKNLVWQLPIASYDVTYERVKRLKMDILMKMLLFAFQQSEIRRAAAMADMLSVEVLFVSDLIDKMQRTGLILLGKKGYVLTPKGYDYLEKGIFEEPLDREQAITFYSTPHDSYQLTEWDNSVSSKEFPVYRHAVEKSVDSAALHDLLSKEKNSIEENFQILVSGIAEVDEGETKYIPCIEFQVYDQKQDIFFARVWNTGTGEWDEILEKQIEEHELVEWRETAKAGIDENR